MRPLTNSATPAASAAARAAAIRRAASATGRSGAAPSGPVSSRLTPTAPVARSAVIVPPTPAAVSAKPLSRSTVTGSSPAARTTRAVCASTWARSARSPSGKPSVQETLALAVAMAAAPVAATRRVPAASQTLASSSGSPGRCRARRRRALSCCVVMVRACQSFGRCSGGFRTGTGYLGAGLSREVTPIRFQALMVTITAIRCASSVSSKCLAASS